MKQILLLLMVAALFIACEKRKDSGGTSGINDRKMDKDTSYAFGMALAAEFKDTGLKFSYDDFTQGFKDFLEDKKSRITIDAAMEKVRTAYTQALDARTQSLQQQETEFLAANAQKPGVKVTESGLQYEVVTEGSGEKPLATDTVRVHYEGTLVNGTVFDSSYQRGQPAEFRLNGVIPGWTEGLQLMPAGSTYMFYIPSNLAYGENGAGNSIPPYSALIFKVELLDIVK
jgi:FKBP-type peptidyl-prolyl cis-trans isomerase FkpA